MCRQEFQYAKKTAKKPVIPVVIGDSFDWTMSVVGLLVAGDLYIHFKDKNIQDIKMAELMNAVKKTVPALGTEEQVVLSESSSSGKSVDITKRTQCMIYCYWTKLYSATT